MNTETSNTINMTEQIINQAIAAFAGQNAAVSKYFNKYDNAFYGSEIAPGKNRAVYVLGHLVAANDAIITILGKGDRLYPELEKMFLTSADRAFEEIPAIEDLKEKWETVNATLANHFSQMKPQEWLDRHTRVSPEDFAKEPHRNKLAILFSRTAHTSYHMGQLALLKGEPVAA